MTARLIGWGPSGDPIEAIVGAPEGAVLAVIAAVEGPSYRPVGACMSFLPDGRRIGSLSSGCIESDLAVHAKRALRAGAPQVIRYGAGSPFHDLELPCGGGLEILLLPEPDAATLRRVQEHRAARTPCRLWIDRNTGALGLDPGQPGTEAAPPDGFTDRVDFQPGIRFLIFGKGPEAGTFTALVHSAGFENLLLSPDEETLALVRATGSATQHLTRAAFPADLTVDRRSAVVLFFHDHEMEPDILATALAGPAFYVGAQGSRRARDARVASLRAMGVPDEHLARLRGPIGLIPSARDPRTLAVSALAEVLAVAREPDGTG